MGPVRFVTTTSAGYSGITLKDKDTLYFISDERRIYKGEVPYSGGIFTTVAEFPETGEVNTLYVNSATGEVRYYNGTSYQTVVPATGKSITGNGDGSLATTAAVVAYVTSQTGDMNISALKGRVDTLEGEMDTAQGQITTINGEGDGSIKKAASDAVASAKSYTDTVAAGKANTKHTHEMADVTSLSDALAGKANTKHAHAIADVTGLQTALNGKADKATTLAGYGIGDAYTKNETNTAITTAVANAGHLKREIVAKLPEASSADDHTIYMVSTGAESGNQKYEEFMFINGAFEKIGDSAVDLTNYATKDFANNAVANAINALDVADAAVANQYVSQVTETDGKIAVTRAALPVVSVTSGATNGTVAVNGADVKVHGLGSAAYTNTDAYDAAGTAAAAVAALDVTDKAVAGQYVSAVSETDGKITVTRTALPAAPKITTGSANGTIAVDGTNVAVKGLGSAAYTASTAYATAAQGALADSAIQSIADGSITTKKLANGAVTMDKLDSYAVTWDKIDGEAVRKMHIVSLVAADSKTGVMLMLLGLPSSTFTPAQMKENERYADGSYRLCWISGESLEVAPIAFISNFQADAITLYAKGYKSTASGILGVDESWTITGED